MKTAATFQTYDAAANFAQRLFARGLYQAVAGSKAHGYQVLVNEKDLGAANEELTAHQNTPEVKSL